MSKNISIYDGPRITVSQLLGNPRTIPTRALELIRDNLVAEVLFRNGGAALSPVVQFERSAPLFLDGGPEVVGEFGEIPVFSAEGGEPQMAVGQKLALGIRVSREMRDFNKVGQVNKQVTQASNTFVRSNDKLAVAAFDAADVPEVAATAAWGAAGATPRGDIALAKSTVSGQLYQNDPDQPLGFIPDTIVMNPSVLPQLQDSDEFTKLFVGNIADQNIAYTGVLPSMLMGMTVLQSRFWPTDRVLVCERAVAGFYSDARPLEATPMYAEGGGPNGGPTESFRSDMSQIRAIAVDEPLSACWITGVA